MLTNTMSFKMAISAVTPDPRDTYIVNDILRDYSYGGKPNYYADYTKTAWSLEVARIKISIAELEKALKDFDTDLKRVDDLMDRARLIPTDPNYRPISKKEKIDLETKYARAIDGTNEIKPLLPGLNEKLLNAEIQEYAEMRTGETLRRIREDYFRNKDLVALEQGVTWAMEQSYKLRGLTRGPYEEILDLSAW